MFDLMSANTVRQRMQELSRFIDWWYGPHSADFEIRELPENIPLPLQLFYQRDGRRPPPGSGSEYFYEGEGLHHLFRPEHLEFDEDGRLRFFMEYQGDFDGFTRPTGDDPPVWLKGHLPATEFTDPDYGHNMNVGEVELDMSLSKFLVTHILITTISESHNTGKIAYERDPVFEQFKNDRERKTLIWEAADPTGPHCTWFIGKIWLYRDSILVHEFLGRAMFSSRFLTGSGNSGSSLRSPADASHGNRLRISPWFTRLQWLLELLVS